MTLEQVFRNWWQDSYGLPPGTHAVMTHVAWAQHVLAQAPPAPSAELVAEWSAAASNGGDATLTESDQQLAAMAAKWGRQWHED